jgi:GntR family transcriptional regulator/MocR family aminotransferase
VVDAYEELVAEAWLDSRPGSGTRVADAARGVPEPPAASLARTPGPRWDLRPGQPDLSRYPQQEWLASARRGLRGLPWTDLGYGDPRGLASTRDAVLAYLGRVRRVTATPDGVLICSGLAHGLALIARWLVRRGTDTIAVEDPGSYNQRTLLEANGLRVKGVAVDDGGIDTAALRAAKCRAVLVTPAHQFPTGVVLAPERRQQLVAWAREVDGVVIEDDYDAEYRYDRAPVGSLQPLAPERVMHGGSLSKSLAPGLRLGWLVGPDQWIAELADLRWVDDLSPAVPAQVALGEFLRDGGLDRHLRRTRSEYRRRRDALVAAIRRRLPDSEVLGASAGLHVVVTLPDDVEEAAVVAAARAAGVEVRSLARYRMKPGPPALVLGYAALTPGSLRRAAAALAEAVEVSRGRSGRPAGSPRTSSAPLPSTPDGTRRTRSGPAG